jgi:hypothetical protein
MMLSYRDDLPTVNFKELLMIFFSDTEQVKIYNQPSPA